MDALLPTLLQLGQAAAASFLAVLLWPVAFPLTEDVVEAGAGADARSRERGSVLLAGSFNPPHRGHLALLAHLSRRYTTRCTRLSASTQRDPVRRKGY